MPAPELHVTDDERLRSLYRPLVMTLCPLAPKTRTS